MFSMDKILTQWQWIIATNGTWLGIFMIYLYVWTPQESNKIETLFYGLSVLPFTFLVIVGVLSLMGKFAVWKCTKKCGND